MQKSNSFGVNHRQVVGYCFLVAIVASLSLRPHNGRAEDFSFSPNSESGDPISQLLQLVSTNDTGSAAGVVVTAGVQGQFTGSTGWTTTVAGAKSSNLQLVAPPTGGEGTEAYRSLIEAGAKGPFTTGTKSNSVADAALSPLGGATPASIRLDGETALLPGVGLNDDAGQPKIFAGRRNGQPLKPQEESGKGFSLPGFSTIIFVGIIALVIWKFFRRKQPA